VELDPSLADNQQCRQHLVDLRWPEEFLHAGCYKPEAWAISRGLWLRPCCRRQDLVWAGTVFQDIHSPLTVLLQAISQITSPKNGMCALGLQRVLGFGQLQDRIAHSLQVALSQIIQPGRERLRSVVQIDGNSRAGT